MGLSGQQRQQLQEALLDAFLTTASLEQMLVFGLDKELRVIAGEGSLQEIVFRLIQIANAEGWVEDLIRAARESNPGNLKLKAIAEELFPFLSLELHKIVETNFKYKEEILYKDPNKISINTISINGDGQILASGDDSGVIRVWNLNSNREIIAFKAHDNSINSIVIICNGVIVSGGKSGKGKVWRLLSYTRYTQPEKLHDDRWHSSAIRSIAVSTDGLTAFVVSGSQAGSVEVRFLNLNNTNARSIVTKCYRFLAYKGFRETVRSLSISADSHVLAISTGTRRVKVWRLNPTGETPQYFPGMHDEPVNSVAVSSDGQTVISGDESGQIKIWDLITNSKKSCQSNSEINFLSIPANSLFFISGNKDGQVEVWNLIEGSRIAHLGGHAYPVQSLAVSADGRVVASSSRNGEIKVWKA